MTRGYIFSVIGLLVRGFLSNGFIKKNIMIESGLIGDLF